MSAILRPQAARAIARAAPLAARAAAPHARTLATTPDPTHPTDGPRPNNIPTPTKGGNGMYWLVAGTGAAVGVWYYMNMGTPEDVHVRRKAEEQEVRVKTGEAVDAGKRTAKDALKESEQEYHNIKASGQEKLAQARSQASSLASETKSSAQQQYDAAKASAASTYGAAAHKAEAAYADAAHKVDETRQSWGAWFASWFGYGSRKADEAKREAAAQVAQGAAKVEKEAAKIEKEAGKRT